MKKQFLPFVNRRFVHSFGMPTCGAETLPVVDFDYCDPEIKASEIQRIFLRKIGSADFDDWTQPAEWNARVSETDTGIDAIRALTVIGDKPAPNAPKKLISSGRNVVPRKEHVINFTIDAFLNGYTGHCELIHGGWQVFLKKLPYTYSAEELEANYQK